MKRLLAALGTAALLAVAALPAYAADAYQRTFDSTVQPGGATALEIAGQNGNVRAYGDGGTTIRVHAELKAKTADAARTMDVRVSRDGNAVRIESRCGARRSVLLFWSFSACDVEYTIRYPRALALALHSENGNVDIDGPGAPVSVAISNGNVNVANAGADVSSTGKNGNVDVSLANGWRGNAISLTTHAGNVNLRIPATFAGRLNAHTRFGNIDGANYLHGGRVVVTASTTFGNVVISR